MNYIHNSDNWIDDIDDVDKFLDQIIAINEKSIDNSPSLDEFCQTLFSIQLEPCLEMEAVSNFSISVTEDELNSCTHQMTPISKVALNTFFNSLTRKLKRIPSRNLDYNFGNNSIEESYSSEEHFSNKAA